MDKKVDKILVVQNKVLVMVNFDEEVHKKNRIVNVKVINEKEIIHKVLKIVKKVAKDDKKVDKLLNN